MTTAALAPGHRLPADTPIIAVNLHGLGEHLYHLPATVKSNSRYRQRLDRLAFPPDTWPTLCGLDGSVYALGGAMLTRRLCGVCAARAGLVEAAA